MKKLRTTAGIIAALTVIILCTSVAFATSVQVTTSQKTYSKPDVQYYYYTTNTLSDSVTDGTTVWNSFTVKAINVDFDRIMSYEYLNATPVTTDSHHYAFGLKTAVPDGAQRTITATAYRDTKTVQFQIQNPYYVSEGMLMACNGKFWGVYTKTN